MKKLILGIEIRENKNLPVVIHKLSHEEEDPIFRIRSLTLPYTKAASSLYSRVYRTRTSTFDLIEFYLLYKDTVYKACLVKPPPPNKMMLECRWSKFIAMPDEESMSTFQHRAQWPWELENYWVYTGIEYIGTDN